MQALSYNDKMKLLSVLESGYVSVDELIEGISDEELLFVPSVRDAWSINDFLVHFLDADISLAFRARTAIAESGRAVPVWDENAWRDALHYGAEKGLACLTTAKRIRSYVAVGVEAVLDDDWASFRIEHSVKGILDLGDIISMYDQHVAFHLPLIKRNMKAWRDSRTML
jgi:hypothetical protein